MNPESREAPDSETPVRGFGLRSGILGCEEEMPGGKNGGDFVGKGESEDQWMKSSAPRSWRNCGNAI